MNEEKQFIFLVFHRKDLQYVVSVALRFLQKKIFKNNFLLIFSVFKLKNDLFYVFNGRKIQRFPQKYKMNLYFQGKWIFMSEVLRRCMNLKWTLLLLLFTRRCRLLRYCHYRLKSTCENLNKLYEAKTLLFFRGFLKENIIYHPKWELCINLLHSTLYWICRFGKNVSMKLIHVLIFIGRYFMKMDYCVEEHRYKLNEN